MENCIFCKIINNEISTNKIYDDGNIIAIEDISPQAPVHLLVMPKKHIVNLAGASIEDKDLLGEIQLVCAKVAKEAQVGDSFRVVSSSGEGAGQSVFHLHYHVLGGWDKVNTPAIGVKEG